MLALLTGSALAKESGLFILRDSFEHCKKIAYLTPKGDERFEGEKDFDAEPMESGPTNAIELDFFNEKLAKIVMTFKPEYSTKAQWKAMIDARRRLHDSLDLCDLRNNECYEWTDGDSAERLMYYPDKPAITTMIIDRAPYKKAVSKKKKRA